MSHATRGRRGGESKKINSSLSLHAAASDVKSAPAAEKPGGGDIKRNKRVNSRLGTGESGGGTLRSGGQGKKRGFCKLQKIADR